MSKHLNFMLGDTEDFVRDLPASLIGRPWIVRIRDLKARLDDRRVETRN